MRKTFLGVLVFMSQLIFAQGIEVISTQALKLDGQGAFLPKISPKGDYILVTGDDMSGLRKFDLATGELTTITNRRLNLDDSISTFYDNLGRMIKIADSCYFLIKSSRFSQKRQIIKLLTSNCLVDGKNVVITIKKPFAQMLETKGYLSWLGQLDSNQ